MYRKANYGEREGGKARRILLTVSLLEGEPKDGVLIKPAISQADIKDSLESLWNLKIDEQKLIVLSLTYQK